MMHSKYFQDQKFLSKQLTKIATNFDKGIYINNYYYCYNSKKMYFVCNKDKKKSLKQNLLQKQNIDKLQKSSPLLTISLHVGLKIIVCSY